MAGRATGIFECPVGENIRAIAAENGISICALAKRIGYSRTAVYNWINGDITPPALAIIRICRAFKVSADWLLGLEKGE